MVTTVEVKVLVPDVKADLPVVTTVMVLCCEPEELTVPELGMTVSESDGIAPLPGLEEVMALPGLLDELAIVKTDVGVTEIIGSVKRLGVDIMLKVGGVKTTEPLLPPAPTPERGSPEGGVALGGRMGPVRMLVTDMLPVGTVAVSTGWRGLISSSTFAHSYKPRGRL